jgi:hypothetical protein
MNHNPFLAAALAAAHRDWPCFPLRSGAKTPAIRGWEQQATTDQDRIHHWWADHSTRNIGIACGPAQLVVIDLDAAHDQVPPPEWANVDVTCGADVLAVLADQADQPTPTDTYTVTTPTGGQHLYFAAPAGPALRNTAGRLGWLVDTRAAGGYVVAAGSTLRIHGRAVGYQTALDTLVAPLPRWLARALAPAVPEAGAVCRVAPRPGRVDSYVRAALIGEANAVTRARPGTRNQALFRAAANLGELVGAQLLDEALATNILVTATQLHVGVRGFTVTEAHRTIMNGLARGRSRPRSFGG